MIVFCPIISYCILYNFTTLLYHTHNTHTHTHLDTHLDTPSHKPQPIKRVNDRVKVRCLSYKAIWPTYPRDFAALATWTELPDGSLLISSKSVPDKFCAAKHGFVRGTIKSSGYHIKPLSPSASAPAPTGTGAGAGPAGKGTGGGTQVAAAAQYCEVCTTFEK